jgi:hypothetical protein
MNESNLKSKVLFKIMPWKVRMDFSCYFLVIFTLIFLSQSSGTQIPPTGSSDPQKENPPKITFSLRGKLPLEVTDKEWDAIEKHTPLIVTMFIDSKLSDGHNFAFSRILEEYIVLKLKSYIASNECDFEKARICYEILGTLTMRHVLNGVELNKEADKIVDYLVPKIKYKIGLTNFLETNFLLFEDITDQLGIKRPFSGHFLSSYMQFWVCNMLLENLEHLPSLLGDLLFDQAGNQVITMGMIEDSLSFIPYSISEKLYPDPRKEREYPKVLETEQVKSRFRKRAKYFADYIYNIPFTESEKDKQEEQIDANNTANDTTNATNESLSTETNTNPDSTDKDRNKSIAIILSCVLVGLILIGIAFFFFFKRKK